MLKKLIIVAAGILVAKAVVEVAAEENEKVSSVVETVKTYIHKVVNKMTVEVKEVREFVKSIMNDHPDVCDVVEFGIAGGVVSTGIGAAIKLFTKYFPKLLKTV